MKTLILLFLLLTPSATPPPDEPLTGAAFAVEVTVSKEGAWTVQLFNHPQHDIDPDYVRIWPVRHTFSAGTRIKGVYRIRSFASAGGLGTTRSGGRGRGRLVVEQIHSESDGWVRCGRQCPQDVRSTIEIQ